MVAALTGLCMYFIRLNMMLTTMLMFNTELDQVYNEASTW